MNPFPEEWELLALFEAEPTVLDRDVPWFYNHLTFDTTRGHDHVQCEIDPSCEILTLNWWHAEKLQLSLELNWVRELCVVTGDGTDMLRASFRDPYLLDLEFQLKPTICLRWATSSECPTS
jgi:hypothetical protein